MTATDESTSIPKHLAELGEDEQGHHSITGIRDLSTEEIARIEDADDLVIKAGNAAAWQRAHHLFAVTMEEIAALQEADPPGPGEIERVRAAAGSLVSALAALAKELEANVATYGTAGVQSGFAEHAEEARDSAAWRKVSEIADKSAGSFMAAQTGAVWQRDSDAAVLSVPGVVTEAIQEAQALLAHHYRAIEPAVSEAAKLLLRIKAEVPGGIPAIVEFTIEGDTPTNLKPRQLALDRIRPAMRAARVSSRFAEQTTEKGGDVEAESSDETNRGETPTEPQPDGDSDSDPNVEVDADSEEEPTKRAQEPVEFKALFRVGRTLDSDLEKAWSAALDEALAEPAIETQLAGVFSLISALQSKLAKQAQEMAGAGIDSRMEEWPLSEERLAALDTSPDAEERSKQSGLAQLDAFVEVLETFKGLQKPANITISINPDGESIERFWSAGAFALLKDKLWLLERLTREQDRDVAAAIAEQKEGEPSATQSAELADAFERLRLATQILTHGDPEAALFHGMLILTEALGVPIEQIAEKLAKDPGEGEHQLSEEEIKIVAMAAEQIGRALSGESGLPVATLLAKATLRAVHKLILGQSRDRI